MKSTTLNLRVAAAAWLAAACMAWSCAVRAQSTGGTPVQTPSPGPSGAPSLDELRNGTYQGFEGLTVPVTLENGRWQGAPFVAAAAARPSVTLMLNVRLVGDIDGDLSEEAVVMLGQQMGGSGDIIYLAVVGRKNGRPSAIATARIGDRVKIRDARLDGRRIVVDVLQAGPTDAMCCPGDLVTRMWELTSKGLVEGPASVTGRLSLGTIAGTEWVLRSWASDEPAPTTTEVTLRVADGRFAGSSGCNNYSAPVQSGGQPGELSVGPGVGTRKLCAAPIMEVEQRFLKQLAGIRQMTFVGGQLGLAGELDGRPVLMLFARKSTSGAF